MRSVLLFVMLLTIGSTKGVLKFQKTHAVNSNAIIYQLFQTLQYYLKHGDSEKGIPVLDPAVLGRTDLELSVPENIITLHAGFANGFLTGISDYSLLKTDFMKNEVAIDLCINFPSIAFKSGYYELEGNFYDAIPFSGMGTFEFNVYNITLWGKTLLKQSDDGRSILIKQITNPSFNIQKIISRTQYDGNIDNIANAVINDLLADYLTRFNRYIASKYVDKAIDVLNIYLDKFDSWRILATLL